MSSKKKIKIFKIIISIITILLLIGLTLYLFPIISKLFTEAGRESFKVEIEKSHPYRQMVCAYLKEHNYVTGTSLTDEDIEAVNAGQTI